MQLTTRVFAMIRVYASFSNRVVLLFLFLFSISQEWSGKKLFATAFQTPCRVPHSSQLFASASPVVTSSVDTTRTFTTPVILFDGVCNFCNAWVDILLRLDTKQVYKFAPLQSDIGRELLVSIGRSADDISSVILIDGENYYDKSDCVLQVVKSLGAPAAVASATLENFLPLDLRNQIYDTVAENRYNFLGKRTECRCGDPEFSDRFL